LNNSYCGKHVYIFFHADDGDSNSCNDVSNSDDSEKEMSERVSPKDDSNDDGYNGYGGYNEYSEHDKGYYYRDGRYKRRGSPLMSPIISPVTT